MKRWFNAEIEFWGQEASNLFLRWKELNPVEAQEVIERTREIIKRIMDNFYELSTNN
jgi:glutaredoxin 2